MIIKNKIPQLLKTRAIFGHKIGKIHRVDPSIAPFIIGRRSNLPLIASDFIIHYLENSLNVILTILEKQGHILIVNTNPDISNIIYFFASKIKDSSTSFSFCNEKWAGGLLTNWQHISKSITTYLSFSNRFDRFLLKNNIHFPRYRKMRKIFQGFNPSFASKEKQSFITKIRLEKPDLLLVINPNENVNALYEAKKLGIPVIAFTNTNINLSLITYPIPTNNDSSRFVHYYLSLIEKMLKKTQRIAQKTN